MKIDVASKEVIHFIGIGGIGMSGLAQIMNNMGFKVKGSDANNNKNIHRLVKSKIKVNIGHNKKNIKNATMIVVSSAIKNTNKELIAAKIKKLPIITRGEMLANVVALKKNIIITGSHGKTTTTSLIANILVEAGLDPTVINGGIINSLKNTAQLGKGEWAVIEADESDGSFLKLPITYSIVTNLDKEHLDYYKNFNNLKNSFNIFIKKTPSIGKTLVCFDNYNLRSLVKDLNKSNILSYGFNNKSNYQIINVIKKKTYSTFDLKIKVAGLKKNTIKNIKLNLLGNHNITNAAGSIAIALNIGIKINKIKNALRKFSGIQRRFTKVFSNGKIEIYDDYAHHPTEINAVINSARQVYKKRKIISIFQPHRYSRVEYLESEFASSFKSSDIVILCPIFAAGEKINYKFNQYNFSKLISKKSNVQVVNIKDKNDLKNYIKKNVNENEMVISMGAGSISNWIREISENLK